MRKSEQMSFFLCLAGELQFSLAAAILSSVIEVRCAGSQQEKKNYQLIILLVLLLCGETASGSSPSSKSHSSTTTKGRDQSSGSQRSLSRTGVPLAGSLYTEAASCPVQLCQSVTLDLTACIQGPKDDKI